jgi:hypothetical protein
VQQDLLAEQGEDPDGQRGHEHRLPGRPVALARVVPVGQRQEQGHCGDGVDHHDQGDKGLGQEEGVRRHGSPTPQNASILKGQS